ncbi:MAG: hypothetical protein VX863_02995, partial [Candidatus Thermoplasmatota archaeon]|nr:hypothetical protein [Candidatus Thermoplasmatota archaeon]
MFYNLIMEPSWAAWHWMADLDYELCVRECVALGAEPAQFEDCDGMGFVALPMGHKWSPFLAEGCLEHILDKAGLPASARVLHGESAPELCTEEESELGPSRVHMPYLDDFLGLALGGDRVEAKERAGALLARCKEALHSEELECHKDDLGQQVTSLGMVLDVQGSEKVLRPEPVAFTELLLATRAVLRRGRVSPCTLSKIVGKWAWWISLRPCIYSVLGDTYLFTRYPEGRAGEREWHRAQALPSEVRRELRALLRLSPFVRAELSLETSKRIYATDACLSGGGVAYGKVTPDRAATMYRRTSSWEGTTTYFDEVEAAQWCEETEWKVAIATRWRRAPKDGSAIPIDSLEGEAALLGLRHRLRGGERKCRALYLQDNQAFLGSVRKGRSSAPRLLFQCRRVAAHLLFGEIYASWVYVPSGLNPADEASRRWEPGPRVPREKAETATGGVPPP